MNEDRKALLASCNGLGRATNGNWLAFERRGDNYHTFDGLKCEAPIEWKPLSVAEIIAEYDRMNVVPFSMKPVKQ